MNEAELVLTHLLNCDRLSLYLNKDTDLGEDKCLLVSSVLKRRIKGEPVQYILGSTEFMGLEFKVDKRVLIPRPETEILVEAVIEIGHRLRVIGHSLKILDIGTGCGNIAISIARNLRYCEIDAIDISDKALEVALSNAKLNNAKVNFMQSDLFNTYNLEPNTYDLIVSNPPYVPTSEIEELEPEVKYEPRIALDGGKDGLDYYRRIISQAAGYLKEGGLLAFEVGINQAGRVRDMLSAQEKFDDVRIIKDYNNIQRVVIAKRDI